MKIGLDMMGGDFAPIETCLGVKKFLASSKKEGVTVYAIGNKEQLEPLLNGVDTTKCIIIDAPEVVEMHEHPIKAFKEKPNSSISIGFYMLAKSEIDGFISAGNTGAMLVGSTQIIKPIEGVQRPTIPTLVPMTNGKYGVMLDVGINADCKPEHLLQFAILGSNYAEQVLHIQNPKVALLNIGEEEGKGNILAKATYPLLKDCKDINFIGNIEGRDVLTGKCDVIVCEGFTGNIILKMCESFYHIFHDEENIRDEYLDKFNFETYGGTPVLGINKTVIVGHGICKSDSFCTMIDQAANIAKSNLLESLKGKFIS